MAIFETQLETWSHQGSITQSAATYGTMRDSLNDPTAPYAGRNFSIFLQGSYGNDTNIFADSDVDVVIQLSSVYYYDTRGLDAAGLARFQADLSPAQYSWREFREQVVTHLRHRYGGDVDPGDKAVFVAGRHGRRDTDVLPCADYRRYRTYGGPGGTSYDDGLCFWLPDGTQVVNFPKQHSANCTTKHQRTSSRFKPAVRMFKNMRNAMVAEGRIERDMAPSYFLEGMLHNVPDHLFDWRRQQTMENALAWLAGCDRDTLTCANGLYLLLHPSDPVTRRRERFEAFLAAAIGEWSRG